MLLPLAIPGLAHAATRNVPSAAYYTIQSGVNAAVDGDTVLVADGTYSGYGNCDIDFYGKNITVISQNGAAKTIIDCQGSAASPHRGFYIHSGEAKASISGFTVKNGYVTGNGGGVDDENHSGSVIALSNCIITNNTATNQYGGGGGVYNSNNGSTITMTDCTVTGNAAQNGGGIFSINYGDGSYPPSSSHDSAISLTRCTVNGNSASYGGGVCNSSNGKFVSSAQSDMFTLTGCAVTNNTSLYAGGGVYNHSENTANSLISLTDCTVAGNTVTSQYSGGGGIENNHSGTVTLSLCTISGNSAAYGGGVLTIGSVGCIATLSNCTVTKNIAPGGAGAGGGVENYSTAEGGAIALAHCTITGNSAASGGGAYNFNSNGGAISLTACAISGNTAQSGGGGAGNFNSGSGAIALTNCTIFGNAVTGGVGGGVLNSNDNSGETIALTNCTLTENSAVLGGGIWDINFTGATITLTNDIIYGDTNGEITNAASVSFCDIQGSFPGFNNIDADPLFVNASAGDLHLKSISPCLGTGSPNGAPSIDKDNQFRPNPPSIGAYELKVPPATIASFSLSADSIDAPGARLSAFVTASGIFSKITVSVPRSNLSIVSPTFTLINYGGPYWYGTIPTAFLKLAKINPVTFTATGTRADGTTATFTTTLQINNLPALTLYVYPSITVVNGNGNFNLFSFVGNFSGRPALYTTVQITLPPGIDYVSADGFTYNASSRTLTQGFASLNFQSFNLVFHASATASTQTPLTLSIMAASPGFQNAIQNETVLVSP